MVGVICGIFLILLSFQVVVSIVGGLMGDGNDPGMAIIGLLSAPVAIVSVFCGVIAGVVLPFSLLCMLFDKGSYHPHFPEAAHYAWLSVEVIIASVLVPAFFMLFLAYISEMLQKLVFKLVNLRGKRAA